MQYCGLILKPRKVRKRMRKRTNGMHSANGVVRHRRECGGKLRLQENPKPNLRAVFELYTCDRGCGYAGRGKKIRDMVVVAEDEGTGEEILFSGEPGSATVEVYEPHDDELNENGE